MTSNVSGDTSTTNTTPTPDSTASSNNTSSSNSNGNSGRPRQFNGNRNRRQFRSTTVDNLRTFSKSAMESLPVLGTKMERSSQDFSKFTKAIHNHVLANFTYPKDISFAITDPKDPIRIVAQDIPTKQKLMQDNFLKLKDENIGTDKEKQEAAAYNEDLEETIDYMRKAAFSEFNKRKTAASSNMAALWGIIMGQCSGSLHQHLKVEEDYEGHLYDSVWLLQTISKVISGVTHQSNIYHSTFHALKDLYKMRQRPDETLEEYFRRFKSAIDLVHLSHDTQVFNNRGLFALELGEDPNIDKSDMEQRFLAMMFVENACTVRYGALLKELSNSVAMKMDKYPKTVSEATYLLTHWKASSIARNTNNNDNPNGSNQTQLSFL